MLSLRRHIHRFDLVQTYLFPAQLFAPVAVMLSQCNGPARPFGTEHAQPAKKDLDAALGDLDVLSIFRDRVR